MLLCSYWGVVFYMLLCSYLGVLCDSVFVLHVAMQLLGVVFLHYKSDSLSIRPRLPLLKGAFCIKKGIKTSFLINPSVQFFRGSRGLMVRESGL